MLTQQKRSLFPLLLLAILSGQLLTLMLVTVQGFAIRGISNKPTPTLVQQTTGEVITTRPVPAHERTPAVIKSFVVLILSQLLTWNGTITTASGNQMRDPGIALSTVSTDTGTDTETGSSSSKIGTKVGSAKVATSSAMASFALSEDFRQAFLERIATLTPAGVFTGRQKVVLVIDQISEPTELNAATAGSGSNSTTDPAKKWQLNVLANLTVFDGNNAPIKTIPFNREIVVETTSVPTLPEGDSPLEQAIYNIRAAGLHITDIRPISR